MKKARTLTGDDGQEIEIKEGIVLDRSGQPINNAKTMRANVPHGFSGGWIFIVLLSVLIPALLVAGFAVFGTLLAATLLIWILKRLLDFFATAFKN
jgi:hypothetical protein